MPRVDIEQNTPEWLAWRKIGGSDSSVLMNTNPYQDVEEMWKRKLGLIPDIEVNAAMQRGHDLEPVARQLLELETGLYLPAICYEHSEYPFITASTDGASVNDEVISEIKCPGLTTHREALAGKIKPYYFTQMQHNMGASGAKVCLYYSYTDIPDIQQTKLIEIPRDEDYIQRIIERCRDFWPHIESRIPPDYTRYAPKDAGILNGDVRTDPAWKTALEEVLTAKRVLDDAIAQYDIRLGRINYLLNRKKQMVVRGNGCRIERIYTGDKWETIITTEEDEIQ
jgi:putative phage-type endonuclease